MKVLVWLWSHGGGGSQFAVNLARRLTRDFGADSVTLSMNAADPTADIAEAAGLKVRRAAITSDRSRVAATVLSLPKAAAAIADHAEDADLVVAAMNFATLAPLSLALRRPLVYCAHDPVPHAGDYAARLQRVTQEIILRRANAVVAHSDFGAGLLSRQGVGAKLRVAPLQSVFEPAPSPQRAPGPLRFLFAGRMIEYKGVALLASALECIHAREDWRLVIAGAGPAMTDALRDRFTHPQIQVRNEFIAYDDLRACYRDCDVVLSPYIDASQSGVVADGLAHGKPCLVTPVGALPEQIGGGAAGWVAKAATPSAVAQSLVSVLEEDGAPKAVAAMQLAEAHWRADCWRWLTEVAA